MQFASASSIPRTWCLYLFLLSVSNKWTAGAFKARWPRVVLLGDSSTRLMRVRDGQWGTRLTNELILLADVMNRGFDGFTSGLYDYFLNDTMMGQDAEQVAVVTLLLGFNDAKLQVPLREYQRNMERILGRLNSQFYIPFPRIILMCPPPAADTVINVLPYNLVCMHVGKRSNITVLDLYPVFNDSPRSRKRPLYGSEGSHFSNSGSKLVFRSVWPLIKSKLAAFNSQ